MLKVLIADDEIKICDLIVYLVPWEEMGLEVIGTVNDGKSAIEEIHKAHPDILITDIRMPEFDGLTLVRMAKCFDPAIGCIIISGHSDFTYAQQAIQSDVDDYLLKPIKKNELIASLNKVINKNNLVLQATLQKENLIKSTVSGSNKLKKLVLSDILSRSTENKEIPVLMNSLNTAIPDFKETHFQTLAIQPVLILDNEIDKMRTFFYSKIETLIPVIFESFSDVIVCTHCGAIYCVLNSKEESFSHVTVRTSRIRTEIMAFGSSSNDVIIASSNICFGTDGFVKSILEAQVAISERYFEKKREIIHISADLKTIKESTESCILLIDKNYRRAIIYAIKKKNIASLNVIIREIREEVFHSKRFRGAILQAVYQYLVKLFEDIIKKDSLNSDTSKLYARLMENYYYSSDPEFLFAYLIESVDEYNNDETIDGKVFVEPVKQAKEYVSEHYNNTITLEDIGMIVKLNPAYFSTLFKKETGMNFMDYVNSVRIDIARVFLKQTSKSVDDISQDVGFNDSKYFSKRFKKLTGLSPNEYRKLYK